MEQLSITLEQARRILAELALQDPEGTLKIRSLLAYSPTRVTRIGVDDLHSPRAIWVFAGRFISPWAASGEAFERFLDGLDWSVEQAFSGVWEPHFELIAKRAPLGWRTACYQFTMDKAELAGLGLDELAGQAHPIDQFDESTIDLILTHWPYGQVEDQNSRTHIRDRLQESLSSGWTENGALVSWAMTALDGSMGYMHTLRSHRKRGIATAVGAFLLRSCLNAGLTPYCFTETTNAKPSNLLRRFRASKSERQVMWLGTAP